MREFLALRQTGELAEAELPAVVKAYLTSILQPSAGDRLGLRNGQELANLAEAMDAVLNGDVTRALDVMCMRFQAVETASVQGKWEIAKHLQLVGDGRVSCVDDKVMSAAMNAERLEKKLSLE